MSWRHFGDNARKRAVIRPGTGRQRKAKKMIRISTMAIFYILLLVRCVYKYVCACFCLSLPSRSLISFCGQRTLPHPLPYHTWPLTPSGFGHLPGARVRLPWSCRPIPSRSFSIDLLLKRGELTPSPTNALGKRPQKKTSTFRHRPNHLFPSLIP